MREWNSRARDVAFLFNPAFCGRLLYTTTREYERARKASFPFPLVYLVLPLVLHEDTRKKINSRTQMLVWLQRNPELLVDFSVRAADMVFVTNEALDFILRAKIIRISEDGGLSASPESKPLSEKQFAEPEVRECVVKSKHVARWFASAGTVETIYVAWGVRP